MGSVVDVFGLSRYGSLEPSQLTEQGKCLREYMASGALIIVLDQKFEHPFVNEQFREEDELNFPSSSRLLGSSVGFTFIRINLVDHRSGLPPISLIWLASSVSQMHNAMSL